jgi:putative membrane protein
MHAGRERNAPIAVFQHWSFDPFIVVIAVVSAVHARVLRRHLKAIAKSGRPTQPWIGQAFIWWAALVVLLLAVVSPIDYWSDTYLSAHVVQHILLAFVAPPLIVLGAPWVPLLRGLPRPVARVYGALLRRTRGKRPVDGAAAWRAAAAVRRLASRPWTPVVLFNANMLFWHLPGPFDLGASNPSIHIWLQHGSFFGLGVCLWLQIFGSYPFRPALAPVGRIIALIASNVTMVIIAMTMVMFTHDLYPWYASRGASAQASDQQIAGAILWVCGEVTFLPSILYTVIRWLDGGDETADKTGHTTSAGRAVRDRDLYRLSLHPVAGHQPVVDERRAVDDKSVSA